MKHWSDDYVGLPADEGARPCWLLLRKVWHEQAGLLLPRFDEQNDGIGTLQREAMNFADVKIGDEQPLDAVFMNTDIQVKDKWIVAEAHIGICVSHGLVLHVERGGFAQIEAMKNLRVTRIKAGPWHK